MDERTSRKGSIFAKQHSATEDIRYEKKKHLWAGRRFRETYQGIKDDTHIYSFTCFSHLFPFVPLPTRHQRKKEKPEDAEEVRSGGLWGCGRGVTALWAYVRQHVADPEWGEASVPKPTIVTFTLCSTWVPMCKAETVLMHDGWRLA